MNNEAEYQGGFKNFLKKTYFYLLKGLGELNNWKNLFLAIFGLFITIKIDSIWLMVMAFIVSIPILILVGYVMVHRVSRMMEYLGTKFGSHYAIQAFDYTRLQYEESVKIKKLLQRQNDLLTLLATPPEVIEGGVVGKFDIKD